MASVTIKPFNYQHLDIDNSTAPTTKKPVPFSAFSSATNGDTLELSYSAKDLQDSEEEGYQRGLVDGTNQGRKEAYTLNQKIEDILNIITPKLENMFQTHYTKIETSTRETSMLAVEIAQKVATQALQNDPLPVIENAIKKCLAVLFDEPNLTISVHESLNAELEQRIQKISASTQFDGRIHISGNTDILPGDCSIEWRNGGANVLYEDRLNQIKEIIGTVGVGGKQ